MVRVHVRPFPYDLAASRREGLPARRERGPGPGRSVARHRRRRVRCHRRPERLRQEHAPAPGRRPRPADGGRDRDRRHAHLGNDRRRDHDLPPAEDRLRVPVLRPPPRADAEENVALRSARWPRLAGVRASVEAVLDQVGWSQAPPPSRRAVGRRVGGRHRRARSSSSRCSSWRTATGNLDSRTGERVLALIHDANRNRGATVLMVTHDARAASYGTRTVTMQDGSIVQDTAAG